MFQNFIAAILTFGLWNRVTKEQNEKTYKSSWLRVFIYAVLTFATGAFLYQSYQVSHIRNFVFIEGIRGAFSNDSNVVDSVKMQINNIFRNPAGKEERDSLMKEYIKTFESNKMPYSGLMLTMIYANDSTKPVKYYPNKKNPDYPKVAKNGPLYRIDYYSSSVPSFFPTVFIDSTKFKFAAEEEIKMPIYTNGKYEHLNYSYHDEKIKKSLREKVGRFGSHDIRYFGAYNLQECHFKEIPNSYAILDEELNTLNFFSAADISRCIYTIYVDSDCPLSYFGVNFDIPVDMKTFDFPADSIIYTGFNVTNPKKLDEIREHSSYTFIMNFPTLENLQLIRSLILTSLVTLFATLFCSNLYFCLRRIYLKYLRAHRLPISKARKYNIKKVKVFKAIVFVIYLFLLCFIAFLVYRILIEDYYIVVYPNRYYYYGGWILAILIICMILYLLRKLLVVKK